MPLDEAWTTACEEVAATGADPRDAHDARRAQPRLRRRLPELQAFVESHRPCETRTEVNIAHEPSQLRGQIDLLLVQPGGAAVIVGHKSGVATDEGEVREQHQRQLATYAWLVGEELGLQVSEAALFSLSEGIVVVDVAPFVRNPMVAEALAARDAYDHRAPGAQPAWPSEHACGWCEHVGRCDAAWSALAGGQLEDLGFGDAIRALVREPVGSQGGEGGGLGGRRLHIGEPAHAPGAVLAPRRRSKGCDVIALMDETFPGGPGGIYYVVSVAVLLDVDDVIDKVTAVVPDGRKRPFHWVNEGPRAREAMLELLCTGAVAGHVVVHYPTGRKSQEEARGLAVRELVPLAVIEGATELIIESRSEREDARDRQNMVEIVRDLDTSLVYRWEPKAEPLLWVADAICGVMKEYLLGEDTTSYERLRNGGVIGDPRYRQLP